MSELHESDDRALLENFRDSRGENAFTELVRRHLPLVFQVALRRLNSAALAEEAAQHTFARLAAKAGAVARHPERLRAWLHRTAFYEASNLARKETRLSRVPVTPAPEPMNRPEIFDRLDEALGKLPELDRELVLRHCCGGEDYRRMAAAVGKSEAACQKRVERALARLAHGLGGARTAGAVMAAIAATSMKGQAVPAAERVATAALKQHAAASSLAGAITGTKVAACAALAIAGGAAGWRKNATPPIPSVAIHAPPAIVAAAPEKTAPMAGDITLAPRAVRIERSLDEVLESIQAGRLLPLVEFLPQATVADLRAIIAEDDTGDLSEGMGSFGTAHGLAVLRWAELDPAATFAYGVSRSANISTAALAQWMSVDSAAATAAFFALSPADRREIAEHMVIKNDDVAGRLAALDPDIAWIVKDARLRYPDPATVRANAGQIVAGLLAGNRRDEPTGREAGEIVGAFHRIASDDPASAISQARRLPWPALRDNVLATLYQNHPPASAGLPPGPLRTATWAREADQRMASDPQAVIRTLRELPPGAERNALMGVISPKLAGSDPWQLLELTASLDGYLSGADLTAALEFAGKDDPRRALALLPDLSARINVYGGTAGLAESILSGWAATDAPAAIRWAAEAGIRLDSGDLAKAGGDSSPLLELLSDDNATIRSMAKGALSHQVSDALANDTAAELLAGMPRETADDIVKWLAVSANQPGNHEAAMRVAALASPAARRDEILPQMTLHALRADRDSTLAWLESLSPADRQAAVAGVERIIDGRAYGGGDSEKLRAALQQLQP